MSQAIAPLAAPVRGVAEATVVAVHDGRLEVRVQRADATERVVARLAHIAGYRPHEGDRVLISSDGERHFVTAVLHPSEPLGLALEDGTRALLHDGGLELRDGDDRLLVRYADGTAQISAPRDLELCAPNGQVRVAAGTDIDLSAARDIVTSAGRKLSFDAADQQHLEMSPQRTHLNASRLHVDSKETRLATSQATVLARSISTTAERIATQVQRYELTATKLVEKSRDVFRTALGLVQHRIGRQKTIVTDTLSMRARRTVIVSKQDTSIDGERVLLG